MVTVALSSITPTPVVEIFFRVVTSTVEAHSNTLVAFDRLPVLAFSVRLGDQATTATVVQRMDN